LTADKKGPIPLPDDDDSKVFFFIYFSIFFFLFIGFDPVKMATNAFNSITDKLPFKLPWK
jgi:hypothetical protein